MTLQIPAPGLLVDGKYRLVERIGGGGMGDVFRAETIDGGRPVAIKLLHPELTEDAELAQRFFQEARAVRQISHPNIVAIIDLGIGESGPYLVMEYLEGESVGSVLGRARRLDGECVVAIAIPLLEALEAAHLKGIIHRDLKPENVFIAVGEGRDAIEVRLLDFGIAKVLAATGSSPQTRTGIVFGTPDYLSPEQATGDAPLDGRSDLFAVGVLLYELLTGTRPFCAPTAVATAFRVVHDAAPTIASSGVAVDPRFEALVGRLLQKEPDQRFATAADVARELLDLAPDAATRVAALRRVIDRPVGTYAADFEGLGGLAEEDTTPGGEPPIEAQPTIIAPEDPGDPHVDRPSQAGSQPRESDANATPQHPLNGARRGKGRILGPSDLPPRFAGRFQVRGPALLAVDGALVNLYGAKAREDILAQMPQPYGVDFTGNGINAMMWYTFDALHAYMELATTIAVHDTSKWREIGRRSVGGLHNSVRTLLRLGDLASVAERGIGVWGGFFSFGAWRVVSHPTVAVHVSEFDPASSPLRLWLIGVIEETASQAIGAEVRARTFRGELGFTPELAWELVS